VRKTIYTAIFGDYDDLKEPLHKSHTEGWDMVCFTDQDLQSDHWKVIRVSSDLYGPVKTARYYKIMFHKHIESQLSMWIDGTFFINTNLDKWWNSRFIHPFTTIRHPFDDCIYQDIVSCINGKKDDVDVINDQRLHYQRAGIPVNNGLIASGILMRENTKPVRRICETWWDHVRSKSCRDQIAFGYAQWVHPDVHRSIDWNYTTQNEFIHLPHKHKPWREERKQEILKQYAGN
jgi:hypothetical protein